MSSIFDWFSTPDAPSPPDPNVVIGAQQTANEDAARLNAQINRMDTYTPWGSVTYNNPSGDYWQVHQTLSPEMQQLQNNQLGTGINLSGQAYNYSTQLPRSPFTMQGISPYASGINYGGLQGMTGVPQATAYGGGTSWQQMNGGAPATGYQQPYGGQWGGGMQYMPPSTGGYSPAPGEPYPNMGPGGYDRDWGNAVDLNKMIAAASDNGRTEAGYTGDFGNKGYMNWAGQSGADGQYFGKREAINQALTGMSSYTGDYSDGQFIDWATDRNNTEIDPYERAAMHMYLSQQNDPALQQAAQRIARAGEMATMDDLATYWDQSQQPGGQPQQPPAGQQPPPGHGWGWNPQGPVEDFMGASRDAAFAAYENAWGRMQPQITEDREALRTQMANQGITMGSDAYTGEFDDFERRVGDQHQAVAYDSLMQGDRLRHNLFADATAARQQGLSERWQDLNQYNQARQQSVNDRLLERGQQFNELSALLQGAPSMNMPQQIGGAQVGVAPPDVHNAYNTQYAGQMNAYNQQQNSNNAALGGLFQLGSAWLGSLNNG